MSEIVKLGDVCEVQNGYPFDSKRFSDQQGTPLIRIRDLRTNRPSLRYDGLYPPAYLVRNGDLLIGMDGEFRPYRWSGDMALLNQRVCRLFEDKRLLDRAYLYFVLGDQLREIERTTSLTTVKHLSSRQILSIKIPLPSVQAQMRIARQIDEFWAAAKRISHDVDVQFSATQSLRGLAYGLTFQRQCPLSANRSKRDAPIGQSWQLLTDLARLETGHTPSRNRPEWWTGDIPWIALPGIRRLDGRVVFDTIETTNADGIANSSARILPEGTVVMSRTASVGFVTRMGRPMATSQDFVNWVCGPDLDPEFLMHLLIRSRDEIRALSSGAIHKTVYMPTLKALQVCVPGIEEQRRIAAELRDRLATIDAIEASIRSEQEAIDALPAALLRRAFGEVAA